MRFCSCDKPEFYYRPSKTRKLIWQDSFHCLLIFVLKHAQTNTPDPTCRYIHSIPFHWSIGMRLNSYCLQSIVLFSSQAPCMVCDWCLLKTATRCFIVHIVCVSTMFLTALTSPSICVQLKQCCHSHCFQLYMLTRSVKHFIDLTDLSIWIDAFLSMSFFHLISQTDVPMTLCSSQHYA